MQTNLFAELCNLGASPFLPFAQQGGGGMSMLAIMLFFLGFFFLFIWGPQRKRQKEHDRLMSELKAGDEIITSGGFVVTITAVRDDRYQVKFSDNNRAEVLKAHILGRAPDRSKS